MGRLMKSDRTQSRARRLRRGMTDAERLLWMLLRDRRLYGVKFRRQAPLGDFVVDFVCFDSKLVVELDGSQHAAPEQATYDAARTQALEEAGFRVVRVATGHLYADREGVLEAILQAL
jgi:adenine-specific DNA-methyltransferase